MIRSFFGAVLSAWLVVFSRSLLAIFRFGLEFGSTGIALLPQHQSFDCADQRECPEQWTADQFAFERATEAYEALIDETVRGRK